MKRFGILAMVLFLLSACQEEISWNERFESGLPASLDLELSVPSAKKVAVTRAINDYESEVRELALLFVSGNNISHVVNLTGNLKSQSQTENGGRTYNLVNAVATDVNGNEILSGEYTVYAIANWSSPFSNLSFDEIKALSTVSELNSLLAENTGFVLDVSGTDLFPMSGKTEGVTMKPMSSSDPSAETAPGGNKISLSLRRLTSHIEFKFVNGQKEYEDGSYENPKFVPTSYSIYNIPKKAKFISASNHSDNLISYQKGNFSHATNLEIAGNTIEFFMLENERELGTSKTYVERDSWDNGTQEAVTDPALKNFVHAPQGSTFIVVNGEYSGTKYFGNISYTIHLGNFGKPDSQTTVADANKNFTVSRNEYHTYTITINGASSVNAESDIEGGANPGAEGTLTVISDKMQFVLDAHYETVMLSFALNNQCANPSMIINTPYTDGATKVDFNSTDNLTGLDYKWIHFMAPESTDALPKYKAEQTCLIDQLAEELRVAWNNGDPLTAAPEGAHYIINDGKIYVTAFIDEYFYEMAPDGSATDWTRFVNTENRVLVLNPEENISADGNSTLYPDFIFSIAQRSIKTTYALDPALNAFGIETWDETGLMTFAANSHSTNQTSDYGVTLDLAHGWQNTRNLWLESTSITGDSWTRGKWVGTDSFGYSKPVANNLKESHKYEGAGVSDLNAFYACLTRNRDENGDGNIDEDEIKWYMPAIEQYTTLWLGDDYLTDDTRLFDANTQSYSDKQINFFCSSTSARRLYYPAEGASYGKIENTNDAPNEQNVRCVRTLKNRTAEPSPASENDAGLRKISVIGASELTLRRQNMTGEYADLHVERDADNKLPTAFQVAQVVLGENVPLDGATTTWLIPGNSVDVTYTRSTSGSWFWETTSYTYTLEFSFTGVEGASYTCSTDGATCTEYDNNIWTVSGTISSDETGNTAFSINASIGGNSNTITVNVSYEATNTSTDGTYDGTGSITYSNVTTTTGDSMPTGKGTGSPDEYTTASLKAANDPCASGYYESADKSDLGQWRVPNQREVMLMIQWNYFPDAKHPDLDGVDPSNAVYYTSSTYYTGDNGVGHPFVYIKRGFTKGVGDNMYIRCVRDAQDVDGSGSTGGSGTGGSEVVPED